LIEACGVALISKQVFSASFGLGHDHADAEEFGQKIIRAKVGLLDLAKELGNLSHACMIMGTAVTASTDSRSSYDKGGNLAPLPAPCCSPISVPSVWCWFRALLRGFVGKNSLGRRLHLCDWQSKNAITLRWMPLFRGGEARPRT
jgi:hypothetical protein